MASISLCMIVKNEENTLGKCLSSVMDIADEIIIVDTGSNDRTKEIAGKYTDKIFDFEWIEDFSAARNFSYDQATNDYILWLDADDIILPEDRIKFKALKRSLSPSTDIVMMKYNTGFDIKGNVTFSYFRERLSKRSGKFRWKEPVHEYLEIGGNIINSDICITHSKRQSSTPNTTTGRNIAIYEKMIAKGCKLSPRGLYYYGRELKDHGRYADAIRYFNDFLDSGKGWIEDNITACSELGKCHEAQKEPLKALTALLRSFSYDTPRAEVCCQLGYLFKEKEDYGKAAFWFELATKLKKPENSWGFIQHDFWDYIPCIELSVCYDKLGNTTEAEKFNNLAGQYKPDDPAVLYNKQYFNSLKKIVQTGGR